ncbi:hypothetical protein [Aneurinibacillus terranovensis]|uniref:hypothetical protein n=1 Tax=Aneurinibacillus terranovensis TaxID=278991 RepID=UPI000404459C|nr:hypothetical protein [Aneurinibacillus terranovensis]
MWLGSFKWNIYIAGIVSVLTFIFSIINNLFLESLLRALNAFAVFFLLMFVVRYLGSKLIGEENRHLLEADKGQFINLVTPDLPPASDPPPSQDVASDKTTDVNFQEFSPFDFPKVSDNQEISDVSPEDVVKALRMLSND